MEHVSRVLVLALTLVALLSVNIAGAEEVIQLPEPDITITEVPGKNYIYFNRSLTKFLINMISVSGVAAVNPFQATGLAKTIKDILSRNNISYWNVWIITTRDNLTLIYIGLPNPEKSDEIRGIIARELGGSMQQGRFEIVFFKTFGTIGEEEIRETNEKLSKANAIIKILELLREKGYGYVAMGGGGVPGLFGAYHLEINGVPSIDRETAIEVVRIIRDAIGYDTPVVIETTPEVPTIGGEAFVLPKPTDMNKPLYEMQLLIVLMIMIIASILVATLSLGWARRVKK